MDYQFKTDIYGNPMAEFAMGHEALGYWLSDEVKSNETTIKTMLNAIDKIQSKQSWGFELAGVEYDLTLSPTEATISSHSLSTEGLSNGNGVHLGADSFNDNSNFNSDDESADGQELDYYDSEAIAHCGLDDFKAVLIAWSEYTAR